MTEEQICKYHRNCRFYREDDFPSPGTFVTHLNPEFIDRICHGGAGSRPDADGFRQRSCPLYLALEENTLLRQQIAESGLEKRAIVDAEILGLKELN